MGLGENTREISTIILAIIILSVSLSFANPDGFMIIATIISIVILSNVFTKKIVGYFLETKITTKFWSWYQYWFRKDSHFKHPFPMAWIPLVVSLLSQGMLWWLAILEFDLEPKTARVSKRHGLYRFTEVTDWHMAWIVTWGIVANLVAAIIGYIFGFETFARISTYYAVWSLVPIGSLDGAKLFFGSRPLWITITIITLIFLGWGLTII